jgi:arylsulfatase A-like enzyme
LLYGFALLAGVFSLRAYGDQSVPPSKPNLVWIWADNLAWGDLACYGSKRHATPNLDRLAAGGVRFTRHYVAHVVCSPSRAALLTGREPHRCGVVDVLYPDSPVGLPADEITLVETPTIAYDIFPTFLRLVGAAMPADREYDGQDIWPLLAGEGEFHRARPFCWVNQLNYGNYAHNVSAVLDAAGRWKLLLGVRAAPLLEPELYDVVADPGERRNLAREHPDVAARLKAEADRMQATIPRAWRGAYTVRDPAKAGSGLRPHK